MAQPIPKFSFQSKTVVIPETTLSFEQITDLEKALNEQAVLAFCEPVDVNEGERIVELGKIFGLNIDPNPEDVETKEPALYDVAEPATV